MHPHPKLRRFPALLQKPDDVPLPHVTNQLALITFIHKSIMPDSCLHFFSVFCSVVC